MSFLFINKIPKVITFFYEYYILKYYNNLLYILHNK